MAMHERIVLVLRRRMSTSHRREKRHAPITSSCAGKNSVILHPVAGYAALGMPQSLMFMLLVGVACVMDAGMFGRCGMRE